MTDASPILQAGQSMTKEGMKAVGIDESIESGLEIMAVWKDLSDGLWLPLCRVSKAATDGSVIFCEKLNDFVLLSRYWAEPLPLVSMDGCVHSTRDRAMASRSMRFAMDCGLMDIWQIYELAAVNDAPGENVAIRGGHHISP